MRIRFLPRLMLASLVGAGVLAGAASAQNVTIQARAEGSVAGVSDQDVQGPASSGEVLASVLFDNATLIDLTGDAGAFAALNDSGTCAVRADGAFTLAGSNRLFAETHWTGTVVNNAGRRLEYIYSFFIVPPKLTILDLVPFAESSTSASWRIEVRLNGATVFTSSALLTGGVGSHQLLLAGVPLQQTFFLDQVNHLVGYTFGRLETILPLGFLDPGQSLTVDTILTAETRTTEPGRGARAEIGDPLDLGSDTGTFGVIGTSEPVAAVPQSWSTVKSTYRR